VTKSIGVSELAAVMDLIADLRQGKMIILVDDEDRENEGDLVMIAQKVTPEAINFMARFGRGLICLTLTEERCRQLQLPLMVDRNKSPYSTNFTVSIEASSGVTTGISASDRARTVQVAVALEARPQDLLQPGHVFPLRARSGGVLMRAGHTEAGCDLAALAGFEPAAVICEILKDNGEMARLPDLIHFAQEHGLKIGSIADLISYRHQTEQLIERVGSRLMEREGVTWEVVVFKDRIDQRSHLALVWGNIVPEAEACVRVQGGYSVLDAIDAPQHHSFSVPQALAIIRQHSAGVLVLLGQSGEQDPAMAWVQEDKKVNRDEGVWDPRLYGIGAQILRSLGVKKMKLLSRSQKMPALTGFGLEVSGYVTPE
jgi:3,4-dihydroxy 2-butanone 4-phosphate synthase/GTP cyclohydrolase II